jgi:uncharacterized protein (DUF2147 family)
MFRFCVENGRALGLAALYAGIGILLAEPAAAQSSPEGLWKTYDDHSGEARALVRIYRQDDTLFGRIEDSFGPGEREARCEACKGERKDQPIVGLVILRNLKAEKDDFGGGDILDPESGSVYRCTLHMADEGKTLIVRGYLGISLFGRSQTWRRAED